LFKRLRRAAVIEIIPWNGSSSPELETPAVPEEPRDPLKLARYYLSLLDSGRFENRAALARHLGVSRARVTQVLKRVGSEPNPGKPEKGETSLPCKGVRQGSGRAYLSERSFSLTQSPQICRRAGVEIRLNPQLLKLIRFGPQGLGAPPRPLTWRVPC
jgi:hypothetical protein